MKHAFREAEKARTDKAIADMAAKFPDGFRASQLDMPDSSRWKGLNRAIKAGTIHAVRLGHRSVLYFSSAEAAAACPRPFNPQRQRAARAAEGPAVTPSHVQVQHCPGIERMYDQPKPRVVGGFASMGIGRYIEPREPA